MEWYHYILMVAIFSCFAYMDHLWNRRPYPNWNFVWHQVKRLAVACILLLFVRDWQEFIFGAFSAFYYQILWYNYIFNPDREGILKEFWKGTKASFKWEN